MQFDTVRSGLNRFTMTPTKWISLTNAVGIISKPGRYGGTYAHSYIALEFASWISAEFKLYFIVDYKRLKKQEKNSMSLTWDLHREIAKINYRVYTDAIKTYLTQELTKEKLFFK